jgi:putative YhbY family RNA-binding protein
MPIIDLIPAERRELRARAHHVDPVVQIGADGLTAAVLAQVDAALGAHGLIKVRVFSDDRAARLSMLERLADQLGAAPVQHIGKVLVLWRPPIDAHSPKRGTAAGEPPGVELATPRPALPKRAAWREGAQAHRSAPGGQRHDKRRR